MKISKASLAEQVRDILAQRIVSGEYPPGQRLIELNIAKELGTSQAPVREALRSLESMKLVESQPHRGARVRAISEREMVETHLVRGILEEAAAKIAAEHYFKGNPAAIGVLQTETEEMARAAEAGDERSFALHNAAFHRAIVEATGCNMMLEVWESLAIEQRGRITYRRKGFDLLENIPRHRAIVDALAAGDGVTAGALLHDHARYFAHLHDTCPEDWSKEARKTCPLKPCPKE